MIKQTTLLFRLRDLNVFSVTIVGSPTLIGAVSGPSTSIQEEIWWANPANPKGQGPFKSLYDAMKDYEVKSSALPLALPAPVYETEVIPVDFKTKKRLAYEQVPNETT